MTSPAEVMRALSPSDEKEWIFGRKIDLLAFGGSAVLSLALLGLGGAFGWLERPMTPFFWLLAIVAVDVTHVWGTLYRVYFDREEITRRPVLYIATPVIIFLFALVVCGLDLHAFWRAVAYFAVFHFIRQQIGWANLYHRRAGDLSRAERLLDHVIIYAVTFYPLIYWHAHLPREFAWMVDGDFISGIVSPRVLEVATRVYECLIAIYVVMQIALVLRRKTYPWGRWLLVATTAIAWHVGIITFNSDYAFAVTNVFIHGVPYLVLTYLYGRERARTAPTNLAAKILRGGVPAFLASLWLLAYAEEFFWDHYVWHDHTHYFGRGVVLSAPLIAVLTALLATPQLTHYVLDGFVWRRRGNE